MHSLESWNHWNISVSIHLILRNITKRNGWKHSYLTLIMITILASEPTYYNVLFIISVCYSFVVCHFKCFKVMWILTDSQCLIIYQLENHLIKNHSESDSNDSMSLSLLLGVDLHILLTEFEWLNYSNLIIISYFFWWERALNHYPLLSEQLDSVEHVL